METSKYELEYSENFGKILRPKVLARIINPLTGDFIDVRCYVDTGADISLLPQSAGKRINLDVECGKRAVFRGISQKKECSVEAYIHEVKIRLCEHEFESLMAFSPVEDLPPLVGRLKALDYFEICLNGKEIKFKYLI